MQLLKVGFTALFCYPTNEAKVQTLGHPELPPSASTARMSLREIRRVDERPDSWMKVLTALKEERAAKERLQLETTENKPKLSSPMRCLEGTILIGELAKILKGNGIEIVEPSV